MTGTDRAAFFAEPDRPLSRSSSTRLASLVKRRCDGEPLAYIVGFREFYGLDIAVDRRVLIPRQETELLVDLTLGFVGRRSLARPFIADVGAGSGAVAAALAVNLPAATVYATDLCAGALEVAEANFAHLGVADRVRLLQGDLLAALPGRVDVIASNPPYIPSAEIAGLETPVRREPARALDGGADGMDLIRRLVSQAPGFLKPGGGLFVEISPEQNDMVAQIACRAFPQAKVSSERDLSGAVRVIAVELPPDAVQRG